MQNRSLSDLQVWHAHLDVAEAVSRVLDASLSDDERARAGRFHFAHDRRRFIAARGILRSILGRRLGIQPRDLRFGYGRQGKPDLVNLPQAQRIHFNVAHSQAHGLFAVAACEVGIDIEVLRPVPDAASVAARFFAPGENAAIAALPPETRDTAFLLCWTRKEAYIKGLGHGLSHSLDRFEVTVTPGDARLVGERDAASAGETWQLQDLSRPPEYVAAVAFAAALPTRRVEEWDADAFG